MSRRQYDNSDCMLVFTSQMKISLSQELSSETLVKLTNRKQILDYGHAATESENCSFSRISNIRRCFLLIQSLRLKGHQDQGDHEIKAKVPNLHDRFRLCIEFKSSNNGSRLKQKNAPISE